MDNRTVAIVFAVVCIGLTTALIYNLLVKKEERDATDGTLRGVTQSGEPPSPNFYAGECSILRQIDDERRKGRKVVVFLDVDGTLTKIPGQDPNSLFFKPESYLDRYDGSETHLLRCFRGAFIRDVINVLYEDMTHFTRVVEFLNTLAHWRYDGKGGALEGNGGKGVGPNGEGSVDTHIVSNNMYQTIHTMLQRHMNRNPGLFLYGSYTRDFNRGFVSKADYMNEIVKRELDDNHGNVSFFFLDDEPKNSEGLNQVVKVIDCSRGKWVGSAMWWSSFLDSHES